MESDIFVKILLSVLFGAILGLETETRGNEDRGMQKATKTERSRIGGFRTYTLISLMGGIAGLLFVNNLVTLSFTLLLALSGFLFIAYFMNIKLKEAFGITTEIAVLVTFIIGFLTTSGVFKLEIVLVILVLMAFFLSQKRGFGKFIARIDHREVIDVFRFGLIALVILPIFPNKAFTILDVANVLGITDVANTNLKDFTLGNPFQICLIVVIISGINLLGYILSKLTGEKIGLFFTAIFSGFISSTSGIISFAARSKVVVENVILAGAATISNAVSFVIISSLVLITNRELFFAALPIFTGVFIFGLVIGSIMMFLFKDGQGKVEVEYQPFSVIPALKFVSLIIILSLLIQILQLGHIDATFVILITALSGVTGVDAPAIAIAGLVTSGVLSADNALVALLLTNVVNFAAKAVYSFTIGTKAFAKYLTFALIASTIVGLIIYLM